MGAILACCAHRNTVSPQPEDPKCGEIANKARARKGSHNTRPPARSEPITVGREWRRHPSLSSQAQERMVWEPGLSPTSASSVHTFFGGISPTRSLNFSQSSFNTATCDPAGATVALTIAGVVLKKYEVKALIGKGSFSRVLRVEHKETKELYALKMMEKRELEGSRYKTELSILKEVRHPNIVRLYEAFQSNNKAYYVLELATGGDLFDRVYDCGQFSEELGKITSQMILNGVAYLHEMGVAHRDLKLENLLYKLPCQDSRIMISDFGFSHITRKGLGDTREGMLTVCGSAEYLAPEILEGEVYSNLVDCWSIGVIVFTMLCGAMPFVDSSRARLYHKIRNGQYSFNQQAWSAISVSGRDFVSKLLCVDTAQRLSAHHALRHPWLRRD